MSVFALVILVVYLLVCVGLVVLVRARRREGTDPTCGRCGYNLTGAPSNRCPECGTLFIEAGVTLGRPPRSARWLVVGLVLMSALFVGAIGLTVSYRAARSAQAQAVQARMRAVQQQAAAAQAQRQKTTEQIEDALDNAKRE